MTSHDISLSHDLLLRSLASKMAKLEARVAYLERRTRRLIAKRVARVMAPDPDDAAKASPIIDQAAQRHGCTVAEICGSRGSKRVILARAMAVTECMAAGMSSAATGRVLGGRDHTTILNLRNRYAALMEGIGK